MHIYIASDILCMSMIINVLPLQYQSYNVDNSLYFTMRVSRSLRLSKSSLMNSNQLLNWLQLFDGVESGTLHGQT